MNSESSPRLRLILGVFVSFLLLLTVVGFIPPKLIQAGNVSVVSIYDKGQRKIVSTTASTVGQVLDRAEVNLGERDLVEPGLDEPIDSEVFHVNIYRARPVLVVDGQKEIFTTSAYQNPRLVAERSASLKLYSEDQVESEVISNFVNDGAVGYKVTITRAVPLTLKVDGRTLSIRTHAKEVSSMLKDKGVVLRGQDFARPGLEQPIKTNMTVTVTRVGHEVVAKEEIIPITTEVIYDTNKPLSYERVKEAGQSGKKLVTYEVEYHNGKETARKVLQTVELEGATKRVVVRGSQYVGGPLAQLRQCESGGNYANKNNLIYRGAYQFNQSTWNSYAPAEWINKDPADAPPAVQDEAALKLYQARGWQPWPTCGAGLPPI